MLLAIDMGMMRRLWEAQQHHLNWCLLPVVGDPNTFRLMHKWGGEWSEQDRGPYQKMLTKCDEFNRTDERF